MSKVLLVAPSCDGTDVGEARVAFEWARGLGDRHDLTVLSYRGPGRPRVAPQLPGVRVVEWDQPEIFGRAARFNSLLKPWYPLFHRQCRRWVREAQAAGEIFEVAFQPVPVAMRYPSPLLGSGIPYVLGPVGGSLSSPPGFDDDTAPWYVGLRSIDSWRLRHDPLLRRSYQGAACVLAIAPYVLEQLEPLALRDVRVMPETGIHEVPPATDRSGRAGTVRLLYVGRLIRTKGARDAIAAMAGLRDLDVRLDVVGDGFDREACQDLAAELGLGDRVEFHGAVPHARVGAFYEAADVFVFPSFREPGGNVQFEAMAHALPLVVNDRGGPANVVDDTCAVRVAATSPESYARALAAALRPLVEDRDRRLAMGRAAHDLVSRSGTWQHRLDALETVLADARSAAGS